ncbi:MAG TPA: two-component system response regulator [Lentisphaeria bacterium]|nr:MAG: hypothetical protein A2X48_00320 [Lentisphaerae bacterium GWF2_49_21]HBC88790.1 two-component system response regulator [Lentisphaeria bacterium]
MSVQDKSGSKTVILIVDDDDLLRNFYSRVLAYEGYDPVCAANGDEAIGILESGEHDIKLGIIDLLMPVKTGWELIQYMKKSKKYKDVPIIVITAIAASFTEFEKVKSTCQVVMQKGDFDLNKFKDTVKAQLKK